MAETTATPGLDKPKRKSKAPSVTPASHAGATGTTEAKAKFAKALEEARAGAQALGKQAQDTADAYREKLTAKSDSLLGEAKARTGQAKEKAASLAEDGKAKTVEALGGLSKIVADNASAIDEKLGAKYGDYARSAARSIGDAATKLEAKDLNELGDDARELVRKSPGLAIGMAAVAGFMLARMFKGSDD